MGKFCQLLNLITKLYAKGQNMVNDKSGAVKGLHLKFMMWEDRGGGERQSSMLDPRHPWCKHLTVKRV